MEDRAMKALSIRQPWASLIIDGHPEYGHKLVENRTWRTDYTGPLLIHAGRRPEPGTYPYLDVPGFHDRPSSALGAFVGIVTMTGICGDPGLTCNSDGWADDGAHHWLFTDPRPFTHPVPYRGRLGLFDVATFPELAAQLAHANPLMNPLKGQRS